MAAFVAAVIVAVVLLIGRQSQQNFCRPAAEMHSTGAFGSTDPSTVCP